MLGFWVGEVFWSVLGMSHGVRWGGELGGTSFVKGEVSWDKRGCCVRWRKWEKGESVEMEERWDGDGGMRVC
ncbi:hypothetical protein CEV08_08185 [Bartonella tribocorum]|uniref:Uncharacterized protein n=1 Tax=Bartonella tribocorum TaxID=85701 RepID=A0A2N9Y9K0_9HYPH|nr:hypothetical protein CEV08_08185 [Bartonella tribocorum]